MASAWRNFKNNFSRPLFTIILRPKMVFLDTDSILRVKMMIVLKSYSVLSTLNCKALRMTLLVRVCFLQPNIMVFKDLPKSFLMQIKGISCEYESKILRTVQSAIPCCTMQYCSWLKVMSSSKKTMNFVAKKSWK